MNRAGRERKIGAGQVVAPPHGHCLLLLLLLLLLQVQPNIIGRPYVVRCNNIAAASASAIVGVDTGTADACPDESATGIVTFERSMMWYIST
jgi:hypothetical protein